MSLAAFLGGDPVGTKSKLFDAMRELGAAKLEAEYSGGNDEGGCNNISLRDAQGNTIDTPESFITREPKEGERPYSKDGMVHDYHPLWEAVDDVLSLEFGTWAGEFEAYGTLFADASTREVRSEGGIQSGYDDDSRYF